MKLKEMKEFFKTLPTGFDEFEAVNGEEGKMQGGEDGNEEQYFYRIDKPIIAIMVDETTKEVVFLHETQLSSADIVNSMTHDNTTGTEG